MNKEFLYKLIKTPSPSGSELEIQKEVINYLGEDYDYIKHHSHTLVSGFNKDSKASIMLAGHIDEIGLMISRINENGCCNVVSVGGINPQAYIATRVQILTKNGIVKGVIGSGRGTNKDKPEVSDLNLDLGVSSKEEAMKLVSVGDYLVHDYTYDEIGINRLAARALDDRIGAFICIEALKKARELGSKNHCLTATTVGEETTMRGACFAAKLVNPTIAIIVDVTFATDIGGGSERTGFVRLGGGPVLCHSSIVNKKANQILIDVAKKNNINIQWEVAPARTGTDADRIHFEEKGIPVALVSIPLRYMHSCSEVCDFKDVEDCINLIANFMVEYNEEEELNPFFY